MLEWLGWLAITYGVYSCQLSIAKYLSSSWILPDGTAWLMVCLILVGQGRRLFVLAGLIAAVTDLVFLHTVGPHFFSTTILCFVAHEFHHDFHTALSWSTRLPLALFVSLLFFIGRGDIAFSDLTYSLDQARYAIFEYLTPIGILAFWVCAAQWFRDIFIDPLLKR